MPFTFKPVQDSWRNSNKNHELWDQIEQEFETLLEGLLKVS